MSVEGVVAVMVHVADPNAALAWYQRLFPDAVRHATPAGDFEFLSLAGVALEFVPADTKVGAGPAGTVVYWRVDDLAAALTHVQSVGAVLYRGPLAIEDGLTICQVQDPWGNCIGLRGPNRVP